MRSAQAKSAVVSVRTSGVLVTTTPRLRQAATSMLLKPTATLHTALRSGAPASTASTATQGGKGSMKVRPLHDRLLVKREDESEEKIGGIIIPDTAKEKPQRGKVVAVGNGKVTEEGKRVPLDVKSGDRILFGKYSGNEVKIDGDDYLILREEDVLAILE